MQLYAVRNPITASHEPSIDVDASVVWWGKRGVRSIEVAPIGALAQLNERGLRWTNVDGDVRLAWDSAVIDQWVSWCAGKLLPIDQFARAARSAQLPLGGMRWEAIVQWAVHAGDMALEPGIHVQRTMWRVRARCLRCGSSAMHPFACVHCPSCMYCTECVGMGPMRPCTIVVRGTRRIASACGAVRTCVQLTDVQRDAVSKARDALARGVPLFLLWAVTGAGKTEMIVPLIAQALEQGKSVLVATPRRDVVCELLPRMQRAFPDERIAALYGGSPDCTQPLCRLVLSTSHQLMRVRDAFDFVIVDEIDAYPYIGNAQLSHVTDRACRRDGQRVWLTATPPLDVRTQLVRGTLPYVLVRSRYHGHPLPVPHVHRLRQAKRWIGNALPESLVRVIADSVQRGAQVLIFVSRIAYIAPLVKHIPFEHVAGTHASDADRHARVAQFRDNIVRILVTTTILERGVTVPNTDVIVIDAHEWDATALIQVSGRSGRTAIAPHGVVTWCASVRSRAMAEAMEYVKDMNALARQGSA
jgi:late competence protein required for DNA uptake (superfamily II DNA/RNA helicase)